MYNHLMIIHYVVKISFLVTCHFIKNQCKKRNEVNRWLHLLNTIINNRSSPFLVQTLNFRKFLVLWLQYHFKQNVPLALKTTDILEKCDLIVWFLCLVYKQSVFSRCTLDAQSDWCTGVLNGNNKQIALTKQYVATKSWLLLFFDLLTL